MIELQMFIKCTDEKVKKNLSLQTPSHSLQSFSQPSASWLFGVMAEQRDSALILCFQKVSIPTEQTHSRETSKVCITLPFPLYIYTTS